MEEVYITSAVRTAIGKYGGSLKGVPAHTLGAIVLKEALVRSQLKSDIIDEVILGEVRQSTEASNIARCAALEAGLPESVPAFTINRLCGSAMQSVFNGCMEIWCKQAEVLVAGGAENMSRAPMYLRQGRWGDGPLQIVDSNIEAGTTAQPSFLYGDDLSMPRTAENIAHQFGITREQQDLFAFQSQQRAAQAITSGYFEKEIVPVPVCEKGKQFSFQVDEFVKPATTLEVLSHLKPLYGPEGTVTAGNSCGLNDGAAALVLMSGNKVEQLHQKPRARIVGIAHAALSPTIMGYGPVIATHKLLKQTGMSLEQIDLVELNEAFAAQAVACIRDLHLNPEIVNISGGAIALGHPLGCTGARLIVTLLHNLERTQGRYGLATLCIGGGQAMAIIIERI